MAVVYALLLAVTLAGYAGWRRLRLAHVDSLTGLPDRFVLVKAAQRALDLAARRRTHCALLMIDLDRFKAVNDRLGHLVGDGLLASVAERLMFFADARVVCGRLGGDEFLLVVRDVGDVAGVESLAQAVVDRLSAPYTIDNHEILVGASVGVAVGQGDDDSVSGLMRKADLALYRAKEGGGGQYCSYEPELRAQAEARRRLELALRHALDGDELRLAFQPVVDTAGEALVSFESLARWEHPEFGTIAPEKFMPLAEEVGLSVPIGNWIMRQACLQAACWPSPMRVAVPVSAGQLLAQRFRDDLIDALAVADLPPERLEIEVSDDIFRHDGAVLDVLAAITALGCAVALKDFGTGQSSLGDIRRLQFSRLKLHRSFIQAAAGGSRENLAVIRAIVALAQSLDVATTAEGVDGESERALARDLGCQRVVGLCYGEAMSAEATVQWFEATSAAA